MALPTTQVRGEGLPRAAHLPAWPGWLSTVDSGAVGPLARGRRLLKPAHTHKGLGAHRGIKGLKATLRFSVGLEGPGTQQSCCAQSYGFLQ